MTDQELVEQAKRHWKEAYDNPAEKKNRELGHECARFAAGDQWREQDKQARLNSFPPRPILTIDKVSASLHQVENEVRRNQISIKISPVDSGIDKLTAEVDQGLIRAIQYNSDAQTAYQNALVEGCRAGLGAFKLISDYVDDESVDEQELRIEAIRDAIGRVWFDPLAKKIDKSDGRFVFEVEMIAREEYKRLWPESEISTSNFFEGGWENTDGWVTQDAVRVANYYYIDWKKRKRIKVSTGETAWEDEVEVPEGMAIIAEREVNVGTVICAKINGVEVLGDKYTWPDKIIPVFQVPGEELMVDGELKRIPLAYFTMDAQRLLNFCVTAMAELCGTAPKNPYIGAAGQFENHEAKWQTANTVNHAFLEYNVVAIGDKMAPPPQRTAFEPAIVALLKLAEMCSDWIKATIGIFDASLGAQGNETSGIAIEKRQAEGDLANFHYIDNLKQSAARCGKSIVRVKGTFYDTAREILILGDDMKQKIAKINQYFEENGEARYHDLRSSKYDVVASAEANYTTARREAWANFTQMGTAWPGLLEIAGPEIMRASDMPGADRIADKLERAQPPEWRDDGEGGAEVPPQLKAQLQGLMQQNQLLSQQVQELSGKLEGKVAETSSRERIAQIQAQTQLALKLLDIGSAESTEQLRAELQGIAANFDMLSRVTEAHASAAAAERAAQQSDRQFSADQQAAQFSQQQQIQGAKREAAAQKKPKAPAKKKAKAA